MSYSNLSEQHLEALTKAAPNAKIVGRNLIRPTTIQDTDLEGITRPDVPTPVDPVVEMSGQSLPLSQQVSDDGLNLFDNHGKNTWEDGLDGRRDTLQALTNPRNHAVDADTNPDKKVSYYVDKVFYATKNSSSDPHVSTYRQRIYPHLEVTDKPVSLQGAFYIRSEDNKRLVAPEHLIRLDEDVFATSQKQPSDDVYYAKQELRLEANEWMALTSLSSSDKITHWHYEANHSDIDRARASKPTIFQ